MRGSGGTAGLGAGGRLSVRRHEAGHQGWPIRGRHGRGPLRHVCVTSCTLFAPLVPRTARRASTATSTTPSPFPLTPCDTTWPTKLPPRRRPPHPPARGAASRHGHRHSGGTGSGHAFAERTTGSARSGGRGRQQKNGGSLRAAGGKLCASPRRIRRLLWPLVLQHSRGPFFGLAGPSYPCSLIKVKVRVNIPLADGPALAT